MLCISFSIVGAFYNSQIIDHVSFPHTMLLRKYGKKNKCRDFNGNIRFWISSARTFFVFLSKCLFVQMRMERKLLDRFSPNPLKYINWNTRTFCEEFLKSAPFLVKLSQNIIPSVFIIYTTYCIIPS